MGLAHSARLAADSRAEIKVLFDPDRASAERLRSGFALDAKVTNSMEAAVDADDLDAVVVCTPTSTHHEAIVHATEAGLHVLSEKPLAESRDRIAELVELAGSRSDRHFMLGYQRRFWAVYRRLREEIQSGRHGAIKAVVSLNAERWEQTIRETWRDDPTINHAGFVGDAGSHKLDGLFYVTGLRPTSVFSTSRSSRSRVPIVASVSAILEGDVPLTMSFTGHSNSFHEELFVHCDDSDLILRDNMLWIGRDNRLERISLPDNETGPESICNPVTGFLDLLTMGGENPAPFECAVPVFDATRAILESAERGMVVSL